MEKFVYECKVRPGVRSPWLWIKDVKWRGGEIIVSTSPEPCYVRGDVAFACSTLFQYAKGTFFYAESVVRRVDSFKSSAILEESK